ncbi:MAG: discoidin domain-containing protein, partial [Oscillospiraceae bacterium]|nr:discoidin domain-containing protein [Oscillospiraceae bacterium]
YWDGCGFAVASVNEFTLRDSAAVQKLDDPIDTIYRYLQFERPTGTELATIIKENNPNNQHPRLLGTAADFEQLKQNVASNDRMAEWAETIIKNADTYIKDGVIKYKLSPDLLTIANSVMSRMIVYSEAYVLTGDTKYADAAWRDVEEVCENYPDWNDKHFLDTAEMAFGVAVAYDMFYDDWEEEQKATVLEAMIRNAFEPALEGYAGLHVNEANYNWINGDDNWTSVCAGGLLAAAIAMVDEVDTAPYCEILLGETVQSYERMSSLFYPDGAWYESTSYLRYTLEFMFAGINSLMTATGGNDFSLLDAPGMENAPSFMLAMHGIAEGAFNFHNGNSGMTINGSVLWLANVLGVDGFQNQYMKLAENLGNGTKLPLLMLAYDPSLEDVDDEVSLDHYFRVADTGTMRSGWTKNSLWAGVHAGQNGIDLGHLDLGEFIFEAGGVRWVTDLGGDSYGLPGYFTEKGFDIYRLRTEANNCLLINPRVGYQGQTLKCTTELIRQESGDRGAIMAFDLTNAYTADTTKVIRGFMLGDDRRSLLIRDEVEGIKQANSEIYWFMNLSEKVTDVQTDTENRTDVLKTDNGEELQLSFWTDAEVLEFGTMPCVPLETSPTVAGMANDSNLNKFYIKLKATDSMNLSVKLVSQINYVDDIAPADDTAIADWTISEGTISQLPVLSSISLDGKLLKNFASDNYSYSMSWLTNQELPEVTAINPDPNVQMTVTQPTWDHPAKITLKSADGSAISEYRIVFIGKEPSDVADGYQALEIVDVKASAVPQPANKPENAIDGDPTTRWSANGAGQWIEIDLGEEKHFDALWMAFYNGGVAGHERITTFDLLVSYDGETYDTIYTSAKTKPESETCSIYELSGTGRYIRYVGHTNSDGSAWISVNELIPVIKISNDTESSEPSSEPSNEPSSEPSNEENVES